MCEAVSKFQTDQGGKEVVQRLIECFGWNGEMSEVRKLRNWFVEINLQNSQQRERLREQMNVIVEQFP